MTTLTVENATHLLRRTGFGELATIVDRRILAKVESIAELVDLIVDARPETVRFQGRRGVRDLQRQLIDRMIRSRHPLQDKLNLFWQSHFATSHTVEGLTSFVLARQLEVLHEHGLGDFQELVLAVSRDPAMILLLDNDENVAGAPNENFAREVMELYTVGVDGGYTEQDVVEAARCFTGWSYTGEIWREPGTFHFRSDQHDTGTKTFSALFGGATIADGGVADGEWVIRTLTETRTCANFLAKKLWDHFAHPLGRIDPQNPPHVVEDLAGVYLTSGRSIRAVLKALFRHPEFYSESAKAHVVKSPVEFYVGLVRMLRIKVRRKYQRDRILPQLASMGQELLNPPSVAGWPGDRDWVNTAALVERFRLANALATGRGREVQFKPEMFLKRLPLELHASHAEAVVEAFAGLLMLSRLTPQARTALVTYLDTLPGPDSSTPGVHVPGSFVLDVRDEAVLDKVRGLVFLVAAQPEFQLA